MKVAGIIVAAGFSRRMGRDKLLLPVAGIASVERVVLAALKARLDERIMVFRDSAIAAIGRRYGCTVIENDRAAEGQSTSLRLGAAAAAADATGLVFMVGDQPLLDVAVIDRLIDAHEARPDRILVASYDGRPGNPVLFPAHMRSELLQATGDQGGRQCVAAWPELVLQVEMPDSAAGLDMDTPEAYERMQIIQEQL